MLQYTTYRTTGVVIRPIDWVITKQLLINSTQVSIGLHYNFHHYFKALTLTLASATEN